MSLISAPSVEAGRVDEDETLHPVGMARGHLGGHPAAERGADQDRSVDVEALEQVEEVEGRVLHVVDLLQPLAFTEAREHRRHDVMVFGEQIEDSNPSPSPFAEWR